MSLESNGKENYNLSSPSKIDKSFSAENKTPKKRSSIPKLIQNRQPLTPANCNRINTMSPYIKNTKEKFEKEKEQKELKTLNSKNTSTFTKPNSSSIKAKSAGAKKTNVAAAVLQKKDEENKVKSQIDLVTGDEPPPEYWKMLAEERLKALEETLQENQTLHERVEYLEQENHELSITVKNAQKLAEMIENLHNELELEEDANSTFDQSV